jgi:hypothetical protein
MSSYQAYYVYAYIRSKDSITAQAGTPYYIGKGKGNRAYVRHKNLYVPKDKRQIIILENNLSEIGAFAIERRLIQWWGRKDLGTGILHNRTEGGEGASGMSLDANKRKARPGILNGMFGKTHSEKIKREHSERMKGNKNSLGCRPSIESRLKMSKKAKSRCARECPHCGGMYAGSNFTRWHNDNCKHK